MRASGVTANTIAKTFGVTVPTVLAWANRGLIPSERRPGSNRVWFNLSAVKKAMKRRIIQRGTTNED